MTIEISFTDRVLNAFKNIINEVEEGSLEHDIRPRFVKYFIEQVLGYSGSDYRYEKNRTDITIFDENRFPVIKIETKPPKEDINQTKHEEQAFGYAEETTRFIILTNFLQFKLWEIKKTGSEMRVDLDFSNIEKQRKLTNEAENKEKEQILFFNNLTRENIFDTGKYAKFNETYARIDITKETGFTKLLERLNYVAGTLLYSYTLKAFGEYKEGYGRYLTEFNEVEKHSKNNKGNPELTHNIAKYKQKLNEKYEKYKTFPGYWLWKEYSGKENIPDDEVKEIFCKETIYVFLNKLMFLRICEDKGLLEKNISNGGIEEMRNFLTKRFKEDVINKEILEIAFKSAMGLYSHFYETGILDWFRTGDGELNELLNRVLWILNQFDFAHVDRDILGNLYEKYLPIGERKKLGEFYTPTEVIDYILTSVGYTYSYDIEIKDLLDPACGSGGFLVRATRRLISRYLMKFGKTDKSELINPKNWEKIADRLSPDESKNILEAIQEHIYGLDINPFACHIAEMNMLFQTIDLYQKTKEKYPDYKLKRFKIYRTDSLEKPSQKQIIDYSYSVFLEEQEEINSIKNKKFDYVVGNPPYVRVQMLDKRVKDYIKKEYKTPVGKFDIYVPFIERGIHWLKDNSKLGYINPNLFFNRDYGKEIRKFLLENTILQIIDFGDSGVFKDVTNYPCIFVVQKKKSVGNKIRTIVVNMAKDGLLYDIQKRFYQKNYKNEYFSLFDVEQSKLGFEQWKLISDRSLRLFNKIKSSTDKALFNITERIYEGFITGNNKIYFVTPEKARGLRLEKKLLKLLPKGRNVRRWTYSADRFVIYPYEYVNGKTEVIRDIKSEYPNTWQYFKDNEFELKNRKYLMDAIQNGSRKEWFEIWNPRRYSWFNQPKIITPNLSTKNNFAFDEEGMFLDHDCYGIILDNKDRNNYLYVLGLLNSMLLEFYLKQISPYASGKYYRYMTRYLKKLPIKLPQTSEEQKISNQIIKKVDEILELHKSEILNIDEIPEGEETEKLCNLPEVIFSINDNTEFVKVKSEENRIYINSCDFIEIKNKKISDFIRVYLNSNEEKFAKAKDIKSMLINLPVPKSDEILREIIKKGSVDHSQIKETIKKIEQEIDELVYKIYGLEEEDIKIIEEFFNDNK